MASLARTTQTDERTQNKDAIDIARARLVRRGPGRPVSLSLRSLREGAGKTQSQISKASGISQPEISKLEAAPSLDDRMVGTVRRYLAAIGDDLELVSISKYGHRIGVATHESRPSADMRTEHKTLVERQLHTVTRQWDTFYSASKPDERPRALAVKRILQATFGAVARGDDDGLRTLEKEARKLLIQPCAKMDASGDGWPVHLSGNPTVDIEGIVGYPCVFSRVDVPSAGQRGGRTGFVQMMSEAIASHLKPKTNVAAHRVPTLEDRASGWTLEQIAVEFVDLAKIAQTQFPIFAGAKPFEVGAVARVESEFKRLKAKGEKDPDRFVEQGAIALGMPRPKAQSLFDFKDKARLKRSKA
jgi:transcriptional regulator with XRE-family HTH domain